MSPHLALIVTPAKALAMLQWDDLRMEPLFPVIGGRPHVVVSLKWTGGVGLLTGVECC